MIFFRRLFALLLALAVLRLALADDPATVSEIDKLASKLPRVPPRSPEESRQLIEIHPDFEVELVAAEPLIHDPVAVDFDEQGRMYVAQLPQYNSYVVEGFEQKGTVALLTDTDGDGRYDQRTVFAEGLQYPTAVACWKGGLFIGAAPDLLYFKDTDGDGRADHREVVFTGFGSDKAGEAQLNSIRWGPDNRFHLSTSLAGGDVRPAAGGDAMSVRGRGIIFDPLDWTRFELTSGGGQHGMSLDDWGRKFVCSNSVPAQRLMFDDRYLSRNPHARAPAAAVDIAPGGKNTRLFRVSPGEPWRELRTRLRKEGRFRGSDEGGTPFGFFTGATGVTIYRGDQWGSEHRGELLVGDVANNLIYRAAVASEGLIPVASRMDEGREFLASKDIWFRPVQMANAPDGTLYVLDMCRELIEGAAFLPPEFLKYLDPVGGNDRGRVYRVARKGRPRGSIPDFAAATPAELAAYVADPNSWRRDTAARLLYERQDRGAAPALRKIARDAELAAGRMTALHSLNGLGLLTEEDVSGALEDPAPLVRAQGLRLAEARLAESPALVARVERAADDRDLHVRYQAAFSLGAAPHGRGRTAALAAILRRDGGEPWMRVAALSSLQEGAGQVFQLLVEDAEFDGPPRTAVLTELARLIGAANREADLATVLRQLPALAKSQPELSQAVVKELIAKQSEAARRQILDAAGGDASGVIAQIVTHARQLAGAAETPVERRAEAVRSLKMSRFSVDGALLARLLRSQEPQSVQEAAIETLGEFSDNEAAAVLVRQWRSLSPQVRSMAAETLLSRTEWIGIFLDAVESGQVAPAEIDPGRIALLQRRSDPQLAARAARLFGASRLGDRQDVVAKYRPALETAGDAVRGKLVFGKVCSACHRLEGVGKEVGADLQAVRSRGLEAVLLNVLDPNREVKPKFLTYVVRTEDGRSLTGMIENEGANQITLRRVDGTQVEVSRSEISEMKSSGLSFMPDGLEKQIDVQAMADLLAYLDSIR